MSVAPAPEDIAETAKSVGVPNGGVSSSGLKTKAQPADGLHCGINEFSIARASWKEAVPWSTRLRAAPASGRVAGQRTHANSDRLRGYAVVMRDDLIVPSVKPDRRSRRLARRTI